MAKEEDLKRVEVKVNVNCCEGCRRKVVKALSLKGVLRTEIHPTLPKVTVVGNVDTRLLIKKLGKIGKIAEIMPEELQKEEKSDNNTDKNKKSQDDVKDKGKEGNCSQAASKEHKFKNDKSKGVADAAVKSSNGKSSIGDDRTPNKKKDYKGPDEIREDAKSSFLEPAKGFFPEPIATTMAPAVNHAVIGSGDGPMAMMNMPPIPMYLHQVEPIVVSMPYYATANPYTAPMSYACQDHHCYYPPAPPCPPPLRPLVQPRASRFDDFFNDDNTVGCRVM